MNGVKPSPFLAVGFASVAMLAPVATSTASFLPVITSTNYASSFVAPAYFSAPVSTDPSVVDAIAAAVPSPSVAFVARVSIAPTFTIFFRMDHLDIPAHPFLLLHFIDLCRL